MSATFMDEHFCDNQHLLRIRHSCEHVLMEAVERLYPGVLKAMGPATKDGFYFDFQLPNGAHLSQEELPTIEAEMRKIIQEKKNLVRQEVSIAEARKLFQDNPYKQEWLDLIEKRGETPTLYWTGGVGCGFVDLCAGPHIQNTGDIGAFRLLSLAGAYWRADSTKPMLQRIYGTAFDTEEELEAFLYQKEEAKLRDHRKLGKELGLFTFAPDVIGQGLPLWMPKGTIIRDELEQWARQAEQEHGYQRVVTPIIGKEELYKCSGHLAYFKEDMYAPIVIDEERYYLRPMNCPHHHYVYKAEPRSYRDLPLRIAEYGNVFRYEASGALSGLMRTRGFCMNDAHIYCREDQTEKEFSDVFRLYHMYYTTLGVKDYYMRLSRPDLQKSEKYVNKPEAWEKSMDVMRKALKETNFPYVEVDGEAAFYGPKVDMQIKSVIGTEYTISTNQLDFLSPERFDLRYTGADGAMHYVYVIHRAPLSTHERMVAYLIEHYAGAFPVWLSPVQVYIVPVSNKQEAYGRQVYKQLKSLGIRCFLDEENETMGYKVRKAQKEKVPYTLIVGAKEEAQETISVRLRNGLQQNHITLGEFSALCCGLIQKKSLELWNNDHESA